MALAARKQRPRRQHESGVARVPLDGYAASQWVECSLVTASTSFNNDEQHMLPTGRLHLPLRQPQHQRQRRLQRPAPTRTVAAKHTRV